MNKNCSIDVTQTCIDFLEKEVRESPIPGESAAAKRLLERSSELREVYEELGRNLRNRPDAINTFLGCVISTMAGWNPEENLNARKARQRLIGINRQIASVAGELATLLEQRSELQNSSGFRGGTHYDVCELIEDASSHIDRFGSDVKPKLRQLRREYDLKYWPSLSAIVFALAEDAASSHVEAGDPLTLAAVESSRASKSGAINALFDSIDENTGTQINQLPTNFRLPDSAWASLVNVALDLEKDEIVDEAYMKNLRARRKQRREQ